MISNNKTDVLIARIQSFIYVAIVDWAWVPALVSGVLLSYLGAPEQLQLKVHSGMPSFLKEYLSQWGDLREWQFLLFGFAVFFGAWGGVAFKVSESLLKRRIREQDGQIEAMQELAESKELDSYEIFSGYLKCTSVDLGFSDRERISLYKLSMGVFSCIGRHSENEVFREKPERLYPKNRGCIGKAWEQGSYQVTNSPDSALDLDGWFSYHEKQYGYTHGELDSIRMKSSSFYGVRLKNSKDQAVAVIVFESLDKDGIKFGKLSRYFNPPMQKLLVGLIEALDRHIPSLEHAKKEGF